MALIIPNIPTLSSKVDTEVKRAFTALKAWLEEVGKDGGVVTKDTFDSTIATISKTISPYTSAAIPPILENFAATGAFRTVMLSWDNPYYSNSSYVEIWRSTVNDIGVATLIGTALAPTGLYVDSPPNSSLSIVYFYWGRIISKSNVKGPFQSTPGAQASTVNDPSYLIDILSKSLNSVTPIMNATNLVFAAESFAVRMSGDAPGTFRYPFIIANIPGVVPATPAVFMDAAYIKDGTITNAKIGSLAADKVSAGTLQAGVLYAGEVHADQITAGTLTGFTIQTAAGNAGTIRLANNTLTVYDASGVVRVKMGLLT